MTDQQDGAKAIEAALNAHDIAWKGAQTREMCVKSAIAAYLAALTGWRLVPEIQTKEMYEAGEDTFVPSYTGTPVSTPGLVWEAMLNVAPKPPGLHSEDSER